jgi:hypothetical protein
VCASHNMQIEPFVRRFQRMLTKASQRAEAKRLEARRAALRARLQSNPITKETARAWQESVGYTPNNA